MDPSPKLFFIVVSLIIFVTIIASILDKKIPVLN